MREDGREKWTGEWEMRLTAVSAEESVAGGGGEIQREAGRQEEEQRILKVP